MIVDGTEGTKYSIDVGRPSFTEDEDRLFWKRFFDLVETCSMPIVVNGIYDYLRESVNAGKSYLGGGFKFCFFFETKEDRRQFAKLCEDIDLKIEDFRNIMLSQDRNKTMRLRFTPIYESYAKGFESVTIEQEFRPNVDPFTERLLGDPIATGWIVANGDIRDLLKLKAYLNECFFDLD